MSFVSVAAGQPIRATHVQQFTNWLTGLKLDTPGTIACTSTTEYALTVRAQDLGTGLAMAVQYGSSGSPLTLATFNKAAITLAAPVRVTGTSAFVLPQLTSTPATAGASMVGFYAKTDATLAYQVGTAATEYLLLPNPLTTTGDMLYSSSGTTAARLAKGTAYQSLVMNAGATAPTWAAGPHSLVQTAGDVVVGSAANTLQRVAAGTATQVLIGGTTPAFGSVATTMMATGAVSQSASTTAGGNVTTVSTTFVDLTDMAVTLTVTTGSSLLVWFSAVVTNLTDHIATVVGFSLDTAGDTGDLVAISPGTAGDYGNPGCSYLWSNVAGGSRTVKVRWRTNATGTASAYGRTMIVLELKR